MVDGTLQESAKKLHRCRLSYPLPPLLCPPKLIERPNTLLEPLFPGYPELFSALHDISEDGTTEEYHVLASRGIFNAYFEFLHHSCVSANGYEDKVDEAYIKPDWVVVDDTREVELLQLFLETARETWVHA